MHRLLKLREQLQQRHHNPSFEIATPTLNLGHIHGGDNPNRICGECELHIDLRFLPGMQLQDMRDQIKLLAQQVADEKGLQAEVIALFHGMPAMHTDQNSKINVFLESLTQQDAQSVAFGTEAPFYNAMGCETIVIGPGSIDQAHQPDEFLATDQIQPTIKLLQSLIYRFCVQ